MSGRLTVFHTAAVPEYKTHSNPDTLINFHLWLGGPVGPNGRWGDRRSAVQWTMYQPHLCGIAVPS